MNILTELDAMEADTPRDVDNTQADYHAGLLEGQQLILDRMAELLQAHANEQKKVRLESKAPSPAHFDRLESAMRGALDNADASDARQAANLLMEFNQILIADDNKWVGLGGK